MNLYKFFSVIIFSVFIIGCNSSARKPQHPVIDTTGYKMPVPGDIAPDDFNRYYDGIKEYYQKHLIDRGFNGAILVAKKGRVLFEDYHGYYNMETKDTLNKHSAFHLASVSKTFTAMAVLKLVEMGKISLDQKIKKYFPKLPYDSITVKELLSHRSGLPNYTHFMDNLGWNRSQYCSNKDVVDYMIKYKPLGTGKPGTHFSYCNTNYTLLALIIEKVSMQPYADFLEQYFFKPLHMDDTYVFNMARDSATAMPSYGRNGRLEKYDFLDINYGDKNIYSTPEDLLKWDQALYTNQLFTPETLEAAFTPYSNEKPGIRNYGLGWRMNVFPDGRKVIYHNGWWHGNNSVFIRMIQDSVTIIVLGNKYNRNIYQSKKIAEVFDGSHSLEVEE